MLLLPHITLFFHFFLLLLNRQPFLRHFFDDGSGFCQIIFGQDIALGRHILCAILFFGVVIACGVFMRVAVRFHMCFFLDIGGVALEGRSKLLHHLFHLAPDAEAFLAGLRHHPLRVLLFLRGVGGTFEPSLQMLFLMISPWYVCRWLPVLPERCGFSFVDES